MLQSDIPVLVDFWAPWYAKYIKIHVHIYIYMYPYIYTHIYTYQYILVYYTNIYSLGVCKNRYANTGLGRVHPRS